jgi:hypothetical protein
VGRALFVGRPGFDWALALRPGHPLDNPQAQGLTADLPDSATLAFDFEGFSAMSLRFDHRALTRTAVPAAPHAALILGGLLLLRCP